MTSPTPSHLLPSVFKPDDSTDVSPPSPSLRNKPWQKHRTTSSSGARPKLSPTVRSPDRGLSPWGVPEHDDSVRLAPTTQTLQPTTAGVASDNHLRKQQGKQKLQDGDESKRREADGDEHSPEDDEDDEDEEHGHESGDEGDEPAVPYPEPIIAAADDDNHDDEAGSLTAPPNFQPFFTILEDSFTGEVYHPSTYYIFADDDPALMTAASMRALGATGTPASPGHSRKHYGKAATGNTPDASYPEDELLPPPKPGVEERFVIVDLAADGHTVIGAHSLSGDWAVTKSVVVPAPSFGGHSDDEEEGQTMMLKLDGMPITGSSAVATTSTATTPVGTAAGKGKRKEPRVVMEDARKAYGGDLARGMDEIIKGIRKSVLDLEKVVGDKS